MKVDKNPIIHLTKTKYPMRGSNTERICYEKQQSRTDQHFNCISLITGTRSDTADTTEKPGKISETLN